MSTQTVFITAGKTSQTIDVQLTQNAAATSPGDPLTGLVFNTASLTAYYRKGATGTPTAITLATLAAISTAWSSGGFKEADATNAPGLYRLDVPDTVIAVAGFASITLKGAASLETHTVYFICTALDLMDAVRGGLTALPNANAQASGGLFTIGTGAGQVNQDANGRIDVNAKAWLGTVIPAGGTAGVPAVDARTILRTGTAQAGASGSITLDASASATDSLYLPCTVTIISGTGAGQSAVGTTYVGSTKVLSVTPNWKTNPASDSVFQLEKGGVSVEAWLRTVVNGLTAGKVQASADIVTWLGNAPNALVAGRVDSSTGAMATGVITAAAHAANAIASGALDSTALTAIAGGLKALVIETAGSFTFGQAMSILLSLAAGVTSNSGNTLKTPDGTATRIAATVDGSNNRTAMTITPSA